MEISEYGAKKHSFRYVTVSSLKSVYHVMGNNTTHPRVGEKCNVFGRTATVINDAKKGASPQHIFTTISIKTINKLIATISICVWFIILVIIN